jgi:HupE / UreJ protein
MRPTSWRLLRKLAALALGAILGAVLVPGSLGAHDFPDEVRVRAFVKPEGERLHFLVRLPLEMLLNINLPKQGPGYLDLERVDEGLARAATAVTREFLLHENGVRLSPDDDAATRISQPSEDAFGSYEQARAHIAGPPLPPTTNVFWNQGYFDVHLSYPIASAGSDFALDMRFGAGLGDRVKLVVDFLPPSGEVRIYQVHGGHGWLDLDPGWLAAGWTFTKLGFDHILDGVDHLLFLLCLVLPFRLRQFWTLAGIITSFTVAHSITLIAAATGLVPSGNWFPPLVETLIAASIVYMAVENVIVLWLRSDSLASLRWRWLITGAFGLIHGFGFSFALQEELQLAGAHFALSLFAFNLGVELGQLAVLLIVLPILTALLWQAQARRAGVVVVSALVGHTAWHWMLERMADLRFVNWPWSDFLRPSPAWHLVVAGLLALLCAGLWWLAGRLPLRRVERRF